MRSWSRKNRTALGALAFAVARDGAGGRYLGGDFTAVGGVARANLARVGAPRMLSLRVKRPRR